MLSALADGETIGCDTGLRIMPLRVISDREPPVAWPRNKGDGSCPIGEHDSCGDTRLLAPRRSDAGWESVLADEPERPTLCGEMRAPADAI